MRTNLTLLNEKIRPYNKKHIAEYLNITSATLNNKLSGKTDFTADNIQKLRQFICLSEKDLMSIFFCS